MDKSKPHFTIHLETKNCSASADVYSKGKEIRVLLEQTNGIKSLTNAIEEIIQEFQKATGFLVTHQKEGFIIRIFQKDMDGLFEIDYKTYHTGLRGIGYEVGIKVNQWIPVTDAYKVLFL